MLHPAYPEGHHDPITSYIDWPCRSFCFVHSHTDSDTFLATKGEYDRGKTSTRSNNKTQVLLLQLVLDAPAMPLSNPPSPRSRPVIPPSQVSLFQYPTISSSVETRKKFHLAFGHYILPRHGSSHFFARVHGFHRMGANPDVGRKLPTHHLHFSIFHPRGFRIIDTTCPWYSKGAPWKSSTPSISHPTFSPFFVLAPVISVRALFSPQAPFPPPLCAKHTCWLPRAVVLPRLRPLNISFPAHHTKQNSAATIL